MPDAPATWSPAPEIEQRLVDTRFGEVRWFAAIDSTNRYLLGEAGRGAAEGVVAVADEQTAGRGRHGRTWVAAPGAALLVSVLLRPRLPADRVHLVTLAAAVAAAEAVAEVGGVDAVVKWPNDLVVGGRKLAGILAEADGVGAVVVGMGLNLRSTGFPREIAAIATACDEWCALPVERDELLVAWLHAFDARLATLDEPSTRDEVLKAAAARSATLGRRVRVELEREAFDGVATALTAEGFLVVRCDGGGERIVTAGDVVHLRAPRPDPRPAPRPEPA